MTHPTFSMERFEVQSPLPPAAAIAALAAYAAEWRESRLPAALRDSHALSVGVEATGSRFRLWPKFARAGLLTPLCEGSVTTSPGGGSVISARAGIPPAHWTVFPVAPALPGLIAFATDGRDPGALAFALAGAALGGVVAALARVALARRIEREATGLQEVVRAVVGAPAPDA